MRTILTLALGIVIGAAGLSVAQISDERYTDSGYTPQDSAQYLYLEGQIQNERLQREYNSLDNPC